METYDTILRNIVQHAYSEFANYRINIRVGYTRAYGEIVWSSSHNEIEIRINRSVRMWSTVAITGLLAHEMSHVALRKKRPYEERTDLDVISRGLGVYLAVERLYTGRWRDHILKRSRDRYLGYLSIVELLDDSERRHLSRFLLESGTIPTDSVNNQYRKASVPYDKMSAIQSFEWRCNSLLSFCDSQFLFYRHFGV